MIDEDALSRLCDISGLTTLDQVLVRKQLLMAAIAEIADERDEARTKRARWQYQYEEHGYSRPGRSLKRNTEARAKASSVMRRIGLAQQRLGVLYRELQAEKERKNALASRKRDDRLHYSMLHFIVVCEQELGLERARELWKMARDRESDKRLLASRIMDDYWFETRSPQTCAERDAASKGAQS